VLETRLFAIRVIHINAARHCCLDEFKRFVERYTKYMKYFIWHILKQLHVFVLINNHHVLSTMYNMFVLIKISLQLCENVHILQFKSTIKYNTTGFIYPCNWSELYKYNVILTY
jgi:hypothetical protein